MPNIEATTGAEIRRIGKHDCRKLPPSLQVELANVLRDMRADQLEVNAERAGIEAKELFAALNENDARPIRRDDVMRFAALTAQGNWEAVRLALGEVMKLADEHGERRLPTDEEMDAQGLDPDRMMADAAWLCNINVEPVTPARDGKQKAGAQPAGEPNPTQAGKKRIPTGATSESRRGTRKPRSSA